MIEAVLKCRGEGPGRDSCHGLIDLPCENLSGTQRASVQQCTLYAEWHGLSAPVCDRIAGTTEKHSMQKPPILNCQDARGPLATRGCHVTSESYRSQN
jgi:hypothetical protein